MQMTSLKTALLAAVALAIVPTMAHAEEQNPREERGGDAGRHGPWGGRRDGARPAPAQAPSGALFRAPPAPAPSVAPPQRGNWGGGQPMVQTPPQRPDRGPWPGGGQWRGDRGRDGAPQWQRDGGESRPTPPQAINPNPNWQDRGQWRGGDHRRDGDRRADGNDDRRDTIHRGDGNRGPWPNRGQWDNRGDRDGRHWNGGDNRGAWNEHRGWDGSRWRNDHRYDWQNWRNTHRDLFRWRYYAPRGFHYRPVYRGFYLEPFFYGSSYWLSDPFEYRLPPVEWPLRWVRYYDDALLVDVTTGEVIDVVQDFFF
jgi:hypothetical protein